MPPRSLRLCGALAALALLAAAPARAQDCPATDYSLTSQAQVNAFPSTCSTVTGSLDIQGADINDLTPLGALTSVGGNLDIINAALTTLDGLGAITSVGGSLGIQGNAALTTLDALGALTSVGDDLRIDNNAALTSLDGLGAITSVGGTLFITNNTSLTSPAGLDAITSVGGRLVIQGNASLTEGECALAGLVATDPTPAFSGVAESVSIFSNGGAPFTSPEALLAAIATGCFEAPNEPPTADAGDNQTVLAGQSVTLDGSASSDPDDAFETLTLAWTLSGPGYDEAALDGVMPTFCAARDGDYTATLTVTDPDGASDTDEVAITALSNAEALEALDAEVRALAAEGVLNRGLVRALTRKLDQAGRLLRRGKTEGALGVLGGYEQQLADLVAEGVLTEEQAATLSAAPLSAAVASPCSVEEAGAQTAEGPGAAATTGAPEAFALEAAYPNPFAQTATLPFALPEAAEVRLVAYDVTGREVAVLAEGPFEAGRHAAGFDAGSLPSGVYLVRLTTGGGFSAAQRITVVR